ncbi:MAG: hypothetical protein ACOC2Y_07830 [Spirochaetota bacterium]
MIRTFCSIGLGLLALGVPASAFAETALTVATVDEDDVIVASAESEPAEFAIYDVYRGADADGKYRDLVDSVYYVSRNPDSGELTFRAVWQGGGRYIEEGFLLVASERTFHIRRDRLQGMIVEREPGGSVRFIVGATTGILVGWPITVSTTDEQIAAYSAELFARGSLAPEGALGGYARVLTSIGIIGWDVGLGYPLSPEGAPSLTAEPGGLIGYWKSSEAGAFLVGWYLRGQWVPEFFRGIGLDVGLRVYALFDAPGGAGSSTSEPMFLGPDSSVARWELSFSAVYRIF